MKKEICNGNNIISINRFEGLPVDYCYNNDTEEPDPDCCITSSTKQSSSKYRKRRPDVGITENYIKSVGD